jgi:hypothetical protein
VEAGAPLEWVEALIRLVPAAGALLFAAIVIWCHVKLPDIAPATQGVSRYAVGSTDALMALAFLSLAGALFVTATLVKPGAPIALAALGIALVAATPMPDPRAPRWRGPAHTIGASVFFMFSAVGAMVASVGRATVPMVIADLLAICLVLFVASMITVSPLARVRGWLQRACFVLVVLWLVVTPLL